MLGALNEALETVRLADDSYDKFKENFLMKNSLALNIIQIGEMSMQLSDELKSKHEEIPWKEIKAMRNVAVHKYIKFDYKIAWDTVKEDIPALKEFCETELLDCKPPS
jgi:uncharacterized protein with HEPN domain